MCTKRLLVLFLFLLASAGWTAADPVIFDNLITEDGHSFVDGMRSDSTIGVTGWYNTQWQAEDFVLEEGANTITDIHWWGYYASINHPNYSPASETFTVGIFDSDNDNNPVADSFFDVFFEVEVEGTVEGLLGDLNHPPGGVGYGQQVVREYSIDLEESLTLEAGHTYYLSIVASTPFDSSESYINDWSWATTHHNTDTERLWQYNDDFFPQFYEWDNSVGPLPEMAFQLTGVVPEPATLVLLSLGWAGVVVGTRRGRRAKHNI
jgi:hypothetical protein